MSQYLETIKRALDELAAEQARLVTAKTALERVWELANGQTLLALPPARGFASQPLNLRRAKAGGVNTKQTPNTKHQTPKRDGRSWASLSKKEKGEVAVAEGAKLAQPFSGETLAQALGAPLPTASNQFTRWRKMGWVAKVARNQWQRTAKFGGRSAGEQLLEQIHGEIKKPEED